MLGGQKPGKDTTMYMRAERQELVNSFTTDGYQT